MDRAAIAIGRAGLQRLLHHLRLTAEPGPAAPFADIRFVLPLGHAGAVLVTADGLYEPACDRGDVVMAGDLAGHVWPIGEIDGPARDLRFAVSRIVSVRRTGRLVKRCDYAAQLAVEVDPATL